MTPIPDYGDPILVPACWYPNGYQSYQVVFGSKTMGYPAGYEPVVLRGAWHCRHWKQGTYSGYAFAVIRRYLRMRRVTFFDSRKWRAFVDAEIMPMVREKHWCRIAHKLAWDFYDMVDSDWRCVIDGREKHMEPEYLRNARRLHEALLKLDRQAAKRLKMTTENI